MSGSRTLEALVGKRTLTEGLDVQMRAAEWASPTSDAASPGPTIQEAAHHGVSGAGSALPHRETIQRLFGRHDVARVTAHTDERARDASAAIGAEAYATSDCVAFATSSPSLHTAAHEAAHVVQQRGGVQLAGGLGAAGDQYEQHADQVADLVVQGRSAEQLLDSAAGGREAGRPGGRPASSDTSSSVQRKLSITGLGVPSDVGVGKLVIQYNVAVNTFRPSGPTRDNLVTSLNRVAAALVTLPRGLSEAAYSSLRAQVDAERGVVADVLDGRRPVTDLQRFQSVTGAQATLSGAMAPTQVASTSTVPSQRGDPPMTSTSKTSKTSGHDRETGPSGEPEPDSNEIFEPSATTSSPAASLRDNTHTENTTRIGFEIELGEKYQYDGPRALDTELARFINQTLLKFTPPPTTSKQPNTSRKTAMPAKRASSSQPSTTVKRGTSDKPGTSGKPESAEPKHLLEMLLDDSKLLTTPDPENAQKPKIIGATFQVEFRTPPLEISQIVPATATEIRRAISSVPAKDIFTAKALARGWARTPACLALIAKLGTDKLTTDRFHFNASGDLAQHVTTSINMGAYPELDENQQKALYPQGAGATSKVELYKKVVQALGKDNIDASTKGRNDAKTTAKSPVESMVAAEQAFGTRDHGEVTDAVKQQPRPNRATVVNAHPVGDLDQSVGAIRANGEYPKLQGQGDQGYLAVAEKLQPPLYDEVNHELRMLIEHRDPDPRELRKAVNLALAGQSSPVWEEFKAAVRAMNAKAAAQRKGNGAAE